MNDEEIKILINIYNYEKFLISLFIKLSDEIYTQNCDLNNIILFFTIILNSNYFFYNIIHIFIYWIFDFIRIYI
jgi:hypothetical protein